MSRGLGKVEQAVLDFVGGTDVPEAGLVWWPSHVVAETVRGGTDHAAMVSTRRAINSLWRKGLIERGYAPMNVSRTFETRRHKCLMVAKRGTSRNTAEAGVVRTPPCVVGDG